MNTQAVEIINSEGPLGPAWPVSRSRLLFRLITALLPYEQQFDTLMGMDFELAAGRLKPDLALVPCQHYDFEQDVLYFTQAPVTAIEILTPTQALDAVITKIQDGYLAAGTQSAWLALPRVKSIYLFLPDQPSQLFSSGTLRDPATGIEVSLDDIFR